VSDNGSCDGSLEILKNEFLNSSVVRCISAPSTAFSIPALNWLHGLENSDADFVQILFSDDVLLPSYQMVYDFLYNFKKTGSLEKEILLANKVNFCSVNGMSTGSYFEIFSNKIFPISKDFLFEFFKKNYLVPRSPGAYVFSRATAITALKESIDAFNSNESLAIKTGAGIDLFMLIHAAKSASATFVNSQTPVMCFGVHDESFTIQHGAQLSPFYHKALELSRMARISWHDQLQLFLFHKIYLVIVFGRSTLIKVDRLIRYLFYLLVRRLPS